MRILITGGAGFIGHGLVDHFLREGHEVVSLDRLGHSGNLNRLAELDLPAGRFEQVHHDLRSPIAGLLAHQIGQVTQIYHLAASTHVDRSIADPWSFVLDNVVGTCNVLQFARRVGARMLYFSTDEVFGPATAATRYKEWDRYKSGNPYAATKAGAEELALSFHNTYGLDVRITHTMNVFGPRQHPEKFIPNTIAKILAGELVTVHADPSKTRSGSRFYIHLEDVARAVDLVMREGEPGEKYNIVGHDETSNLGLVQRIGRILGVEPKIEMVDFHGSRPGHDLRYALDGSRLRDMGFRHNGLFPAQLKETVEWTLNHRKWLPPLGAEARPSRSGLISAADSTSERASPALIAGN